MSTKQTKKKSPAKSTAVAKREPAKTKDVALMPSKHKETPAPVQVLAPVTVRKLDDDIDLGDLGLVEMRFTEEE